MTLYRVNRDDKTYSVGPVGPYDPMRGTRLGLYSEDKADLRTMEHNPPMSFAQWCDWQQDIWRREHDGQVDRQE